MLRILFAASPALACPSLELLLENSGTEFQVQGILTQADKPTGRKKIIQACPVKEMASKLKLEVHCPDKLDAAFRQKIEGRYDLLVVFAYGKIFGPKFLALFPYGAINLHPSKLPEFRGPSPLEACLLAGQKKLGISVQRLVLEMDAGPILEQEEYPIEASFDYNALANMASKRGAELLLRACKGIASKDRQYLEQAREQRHEDASFCKLIRKEDGLVNWSDSAEQLERMARAYCQWPQIFSYLGQEKVIFHHLAIYSQDDIRVAEPGSILGLRKSQDGAVILVQCGLGIVAIGSLQRQSRKQVSAQEFQQNFPQQILRLRPSSEDTDDLRSNLQAQPELGLLQFSNQPC